MRIKRIIDKLIGSPFERLQNAVNEISVLRYELDNQRSLIQDLQSKNEDVESRFFACHKDIDSSFFTYREYIATKASRDLSSIKKPLLKTDRIAIEQAFLELERFAPQAYAKWMQLFQVNDEEYANEPADSCSVEGNVYALRFKQFIAPYLNGNVLDIGCGPVALPIYLKDYPLEFVYGIDPLPAHEAHPFHFEQIITEFLPWEDNSFQTILACTSLDHVLLLDKAMREIIRVMENGAILLFCDSFLQGAPLFDPYAKDIMPVDRFHLFHFDQPWLENMLDSLGFSIIEHHTYLAGQYYACRLNK